MYQEARYLLHEEITSPHVCWSILQVLGTGTGRISEIAGRLSLPANQLTRYMELLQDLQLVYREVPVLEKNPARSKKGFYQVSDPFLRLWFGSIYPYDSFLEFGQLEAIKERLQPMIEAHAAFCFEQLSRLYVQRFSAQYNCLKCKLCHFLIRTNIGLIVVHGFLLSLHRDFHIPNSIKM